MTTITHSAALLAILAAAATPSAAGWDPIGDVTNFVEDTIEEVDESITQPVLDAAENTIEQAQGIVEDVAQGAAALSGAAVVVDLVQGDSLDDALDEALEDAKAAAVAVAEIPALANHGLAAAVEVAGNVGGEGAADVAGLVTLGDALANSLPAALVQSLIASSESAENLPQIATVPLAALLRHVIQVHEPEARPLPGPIVRLLEPTFGEAHLATVRYAVEDGTSDLAGLINAMQTSFGKAGNHAVTVGPIIVFDHEPGSAASDLFFWAHEVQHTVQYAEMGVEGFAAAYTTDYQGLAADADAAAQRAVEEANAFFAALAS